MTDLPDFLLARFADDKAVAQAAYRAPDPRWPDQGWLAEWDTDPEGISPEAWAQLARWSPARVLAECEAKRLIVEAEPERWVLQPDAPGHTVDMGTPEGMVRVYGKLITELEYRDRYMELAPPSQTLLYLALPYADHPDFREEWRA